jgi:hypothetical protein
MLWVKESCHLQYDLPFNPCAVGGLYPSGNFNCFSFNNKLKICSTLLTSKSNPFAGPVCFTHLQGTGFAPRAHSATDTSNSSPESSASSVVAEPLELFQLKCVIDRRTTAINLTHFKRNNPLVCRVSVRYNHGSAGSKQVHLARRRVHIPE